MKAKQMETEKWLKNKSEDKSKKPNCSKSPYSKRRDLDEKNQLHEQYSKMKQDKETHKRYYKQDPTRWGKEDEQGCRNTGNI